MIILNEEYYKELFRRVENISTLSSFKDNISCLTVKFILEYYHKNQSIHFNLQNSPKTTFEICEHLFLEFANDIFVNHYDLPTLVEGSKLRDKRKYADRKRHDYIIKSIINGIYRLEHTKNKAQLSISYDDLVKKFIPIEQGTRQATLQSYTKFFADLNNRVKIDFVPTNFEKKIVFIAKKSFWDKIPNRNKIPCTYLPNPNEGNDVNPIKSIPALLDCLVYFTPKYEVCYQNILTKRESIKAIIVFDTEEDKIEQILQDKNRFGFNLIIISNSVSPGKNQSIPCWNWFKEELEIVNALSLL